MLNIKNLTLKQKIGQMIICGFNGTDINDDICVLTSEYCIGNFILFKRNIKNYNQIKKLCADLNDLTNQYLNIKPFIASDEESGMVSRFKDITTNFPGNMSVGSVNDKDLAFDYAFYLGKELLDIGVNMNISPVLDINTNYKNPVIGIRAFSDKTEVVCDMGDAVISGFNKSNIISVGKHFPGHGDTETDSHLGLPVVSHDLDRLKSIELQPFISAIKNNIPAIMISHIVVSKIDDKLPASCSKKIITDLLEKELGYQGLIITDCFEMDAIAKHIGINKAIIKSIKAGANIIDISHTKEKQISAVTAVYDAVISGELDENIIDKSVEKILRLKNNIKDNNFDINIIKKESIKISRAISEKSIKLIFGEKPEITDKTLFISVIPFASTPAEDDPDKLSLGEYLLNKEKINNIDICHEIDDNQIKKLLEISSNYDNIIFIMSDAYIYSRQRVLYSKLLETSKNLTIISMKTPYDIEELPKCNNYINAFEYTINSMESLAKYLFNRK